MTVHDRVKESFEPTVLQKLCVGFYGVYNITGLPQAGLCVKPWMVKLKVDKMLGIRTELIMTVHDIASTTGFILAPTRRTNSL